jgi:O-antigen/teichoic acid export membrane protein
VATVLAQAVALLRYVVMARLLGPEQLGLAATLVITASFFDLISDTGADRFLIQDRDGDTARVQGLVQLVYVGRGFAIAAGLLLFAWPIARFYRAPELVGGLMILALSPLILGFLHLDVRRTQRGSDFRAEAVMTIAAEVSSLAATMIAAWLTRSFTAILYGLITRAVVMVLVSHLFATRPYRLGYAREHARRLAAFAAPLMLSGILLFVGSQGDRVLVANRLGFAELGHYSAVLLLILYPASAILRYMHVIYLPLAAAGRDDEAGRDRVSDLLGGQTQLLALAMSVGFAVVAPPMVTILYGAKFTQSALLIGMIGILQTTRFLINWPNTVALSMGRSRTVLIGNLVRLLAFPSAFLGVALIGGLRGVVAGFIAGELISIAVSLVLLNRNMGKPPIQGFDRFAAFFLASAAIVGWNLAIERRSVTAEIALLGASLLLAAWIVRRESMAIRHGVDVAGRLLRRRADAFDGVDE